MEGLAGGRPFLCAISFGQTKEMAFFQLKCTLDCLLLFHMRIFAPKKSVRQIELQGLSVVIAENMFMSEFECFFVFCFQGMTDSGKKADLPHVKSSMRITPQQIKQRTPDCILNNTPRMNGIG